MIQPRLGWKSWTGSREEGEEEELEDEETGNGENAEAGGMSTSAQTSRGGRHGMTRED